MTDPTPADRALLAWQTLPCRYPSCRQPVGRRCVTARGDRTSPHAIRLADLDIWLSRQPEVDALTAQVASLTADLKLEQVEYKLLGDDLDEMEGERNALTAQLAAEKASHSADIQAAVATDARLREQIRQLQQQIADLLAYKAAHPDVPSVWKPLRIHDLTRDEGWTHTTGVRANVDASYNQKAQTTFGPGGMTITVKRDTTGKIVSSDAQGRFAPLPNYFALEVDIDFGGWLGSGCFPAFWFRPMSGHGWEGELDGFEYRGNFVGQASEVKTTAISTPYTDAAGKSVWKQLEKAFGPANGRTTYPLRFEKTPGQFLTLLEDKVVATLTRADWAKKNAATEWDRCFEVAAQMWYPRPTYQFGPPADGKSYNSAGPVPANWTESSMTIPRMVAEKYVG